MHNRYSVTEEGLQKIASGGLSVPEVLQVLGGAGRIFWHPAEGVAAELGETMDGRRLIVMLVEADQEDNDWDIVAAWQMTSQESTQYDHVQGMRRPRS